MSNNAMTYRVGIDIGGTFTDFAMLKGEQVILHKNLSTPQDRSLGVIFGVARALLLLGLFYLPFHLMMPEKPKEEFFANSQTHYFIEKIA